MVFGVISRLLNDPKLKLFVFLSVHSHVHAIKITDFFVVCCFRFSLFIQMVLIREECLKEFFSKASIYNLLLNLSVFRC